MRAHFAVEEIEKEPLHIRIKEFKENAESMEILIEFINDVLQTAELEIDKKQKITQQESREKERSSFGLSDLKSAKVVNRARGLVVRLFDAICNCANTAAAPAQRIRIRRSTKQ